VRRAVIALVCVITLPCVSVAAALAQSGWVLAAPPFDDALTAALWATTMRAAGKEVPAELQNRADFERLHRVMESTNGVSPPSDRWKLIADAFIDRTAPVTKWLQLRAFDTANECERTRVALVRRADQEITALASRPEVTVGDLQGLTASSRAPLAKCMPASAVYPGEQGR
jgi:hypothetical protein